MTTPSKLTPELKAQLRASCGSLLHNNRINPRTQKGRSMIHAFWVGALTAIDETQHPIVIFMVSGRYEELITMPDPKGE